MIPDTLMRGFGVAPRVGKPEGACEELQGCLLVRKEMIGTITVLIKVKAWVLYLAEACKRVQKKHWLQMKRNI